MTLWRNNNDAKGFFDCIVHTVKILVLLSFGMLLMATRALFETLQKAEHHIKQATVFWMLHMVMM